MASGDEMKRLLELVKESSITYGDFTLSSGIRSSYYFDGRMTTLSPEGAYLVGRKVFQLLKEADIQAVGGPTLGADPIVAAVTLVSYMEGKPIPAFIVRKEPKEHGMRRHIEGNLPPGASVAIVDDVITTGGAIFKAIRAVEEEGCQVGKIVVLLDRNQGGSDELRKKGYEVKALLIADACGNVSIPRTT